MRKGIADAKRTAKQETSNSDKCDLGNLDLLNLRLRVSDNDRRTLITTKGSGDNHHNTHAIVKKDLRHPLQRTIEQPLPNCRRLPQGYDQSKIFRQLPKEAQLKVEKSLENFLLPSVKRHQGAVTKRVNNCGDAGNFPFDATSSGNLKIKSRQVVFESKKLSVLVANPETTRVSVVLQNSRSDEKRMANGSGEFSKNSAMDAILSQAGISGLGSIIGETPLRQTNDVASEYESKETCEILDPELNLNRLGCTGAETIDWKKVVLPEKTNLYLELCRRITNKKNTDCKVHIGPEQFSCHLIVLQCYSDLFDGYISIKKVEIPADRCSASSFAYIYDWMVNEENPFRYLARDNVLDIFNSAKYLKIKDLIEQCWAFIDNLDVFNEDNAFLLYVDAKIKQVEEVRELMVPRIQEFFLMLVSSQDWLELDVEDVKIFLKSNYVKVNCEMEIFMSAVRWLKHDWDNRDKYKYEVLTCVRFGNIAPWQLVDIKRNPENPEFMELAKDAAICKLIDDGLAFVIIKYWYGQENDDFQHWNAVLGLQEPPSRNWSGLDKTYFTYREFLIYLDQYRRHQLIAKTKPKVISEKRSSVGSGTVLFPEEPVPSMEDFLSKKKDFLVYSMPQVHTLLTKKEIASKKLSVAESRSQHNWNILKYLTQPSNLMLNEYSFPKSAEADTLKLFSSPTDQILERSEDVVTASSQGKENAKLLGAFNPFIFGDHQETEVLKLVSKNRATAWNPLKDHINPPCGHNELNSSLEKSNTMKLFTKSMDSLAKSNTNRLSASALGFAPKKYAASSSLFFEETEAVLILGGTNPYCSFTLREGNGRNIYRYRPKLNDWELVGVLPEPRQHLAAQFMRGRIYLAGGVDPRSDDVRGKEVVVDTVWSFEPVHQSWFSERCLITARKFFGFVATNHCLFAIGGQGRRKKMLNSVEKFDLEQGTWVSIAPMRHARGGLSCVKYRNVIWAAGGQSQQNNFLDVVEGYNIENNQWSLLRRLTFPRAFSTMCVMSDSLYIIGGVAEIKGSNKTTSSIDSVDMWDRSRTDWKAVAQMAIPRHGHSIAYFGSQFFVAGGVTTVYTKCLSNVECFCTKREKWLHGVACLPCPLSGHAAVTLPPTSLIYFL